jgi:hypothetical protein
MVMMSRYAIPEMKKVGRGVIVNMYAPILPSDGSPMTGFNSGHPSLDVRNPIKFNIGLAH